MLQTMKTHQTHFTVPEMPWKREEATEPLTATPTRPLADVEDIRKPATLKRKFKGDFKFQYCACGERGEHWDGTRWYCGECYDNGDDED